jgi:methylated-DNA-[protein]-cysteine S-methyltransferase
VTAFTRFASPLGELILTASETALTGVYFPTSHGTGGKVFSVADPGTGGEVLSLATRQLSEYFAGTRSTFDLPLDATGSAFEHRVWDVLRTIPYGTTTSYGELARRLGDPRLTRAVGAANGKNPIPIIVPCHRVVGANGDLTGFGGGLDRKRWLLEHEGALLALGR